MATSTYIIKYEVKFNDNSSITGKEIKVKNCYSGIHAQIRLEDFLKKKHKNFKQLIVNNCSEDILNIFGNIFNNNSFNDIFKGFK